MYAIVDWHILYIVLNTWINEKEEYPALLLSYDFGSTPCPLLASIDKHLLHTVLHPLYKEYKDKEMGGEVAIVAVLLTGDE